jgi:sirohydrochlorin cobaltochelatase
MMKAGLSGDSAILVCGHGSRDQAAVTEFLRMVEALRQKLPERDLAHGFLEINEPSITQSLETMYRRGCRQISVLPAMLFAAAHVREDIPGLLAAFQKDHPDCHMTLGRELGVSPDLIDAAADRVARALDQAGQVQQISPEKTALLVVARGSRDEAALGDLAEITEVLKIRSGLENCFTCYASIAQPLMRDKLAELCGQDIQRILFLPWFLFTGILMKRLHDEFDEAAQANTETEFIALEYFCDHPGVTETFARRYQELLDNSFPPG